CRRIFLVLLLLLSRTLFAYTTLFRSLRFAGELARDGRTVVVVLHDLSLAGAYADRVALLDHGRLRALGTALEVLTEQLIAEVYRDRKSTRLNSSHVKNSYAVFCL